MIIKPNSFSKTGAFRYKEVVLMNIWWAAKYGEYGSRHTSVLYILPCKTMEKKAAMRLVYRGKKC